MANKLTKYEYLVKLEESGMLEDLKNRGIINAKIHTYYRYFREVQFLMLKESLNKAVVKAAQKFGVDERTMWRAMKVMRS